MRYVLLIISLALFGCGSAEKDQEDQEGVFDPMVETIDKAKEVEDITMQHKEDMDKRLKEMEGGDDE
jgi:hypothetical protein